MSGSNLRPQELSKRSCVCVLLSLSMSGWLAPPVVAKRPAFDLPTCAKLLDGASPAYSDSARGSAPGSSDLSPLKLDDGSEVMEVGGDGRLKGTVRTSSKRDDGQAHTVYEENTALDGSNQSLITGKTDASLHDKLLKDAKTVDVMPLALVESDSEAANKQDAVSQLERAQLTDLWQATINRSPDIQFVVNRLQPSSDANHATASAMRFLSGALFGAMQAAPMMLGPGASSLQYMGTGMGTSLMANVLGAADRKTQKKQQISQEQATMLYKIVRETADRLVEKYRAYKKTNIALDRAENDLRDLKLMVADGRIGQDPAKAIEMEYTLRKQQRDIDSIGDEIREKRQSLLDLAGGEAVSRLDMQITEEKAMLHKLVGPDGNPTMPSPNKGPESAATDKSTNTYGQFGIGM